VEIYRKSLLKNGDEGPYLKAIALLGAAEPAVRGMAPIDMSGPSESNPAPAFDATNQPFESFTIPANPEKFEQAEQFAQIVVPQVPAKTKTEEGHSMSTQETPPGDGAVPPAVDPVAFSRLKEDNERLTAQVSALAARAYKAEQATIFSARFDQFTKDGIPVPAIRDQALEVFENLPQDNDLRTKFLDLFGLIPVAVSTSPERFAASHGNRPSASGDWHSDSVQSTASAKADAICKADPTINFQQALHQVRAEFFQNGGKL
jgi:hypothetical protein